MTQIGGPGSRALLAFIRAVPLAVEGRGGGSARGHAIACLCSSRNRQAKAHAKADPDDGLERTIRVNVTVPEDELERIDRFADEHGYTRSGFLLRAARREMKAA
jgi:HicB_like antitoxin of bacterial toxin-antitoxin system